MPPFHWSQKKAGKQQDLCQPKKVFNIPGAFNIPGSKWKLVGDRDNTHDEIEQSGNIDALQRYRIIEDRGCVQYDHPQVADKDPLISHHLYFIEEDLREVVQEEESIKLHDLNQHSAERMDVLSRKYWLLEQRWWSHYYCLRQTYQRPGFDLWRSHPKWYMHQVLKDDCASRNGCCARACGCCYLREPSPMRRLGLGHCTTECGCCCKARGFRISEEDKNVLKKEFREKTLQCPKHPIIRVASWGIVGGCYESPFDMIQVDGPPSYENTNSTKEKY